MFNNVEQTLFTHTSVVSNPLAAPGKSITSNKQAIQRNTSAMRMSNVPDRRSV